MKRISLIIALALLSAAPSAARADPRIAKLCGPDHVNEAVSADGPVAYWRFEETPGTPTASDSGSSGTDGTYNGITLGVPGPTENLGTAAEWSEPALPDNPGSSNIDFGEFGDYAKRG